MARAAKDARTGLTPKQMAFCLEYVANGGNASAAYRAAFKPMRATDKTINEKASRLLKGDKIQARLQALSAGVTQKAVERAAVDKAYVMDRLQLVAERCMQAQPVLDRKGDPVLIETRSGGLAPAYVFQANGANRALELLGKEIGMFLERKETGQPGAFDALEKMSVEELRRRVQQKAIRLGLGKVIRFRPDKK